MKLMIIEAPHFTAGAVFEPRSKHSYCTEAAPIIGWMIGRTEADIRAWLQKKSYAWQWVRQ